MDKLEVQERVRKGGKPLPLDDFRWCEETRTFSSAKGNLVIDFGGLYQCTFKTGPHCTFKTDSYCTFDTGSDCTFNTGSYCTFNTGTCCTFNTDSDCTFNTGAHCTFDTDSDCTFDTGYDCTFKTGPRCVIVRRDIFSVINPEEGQEIKLFPYNAEGYLVDGMYKGKPHIIADGIVSEVLSKKGNIYKVINMGEDAESYVAKDGDNYAHGATIKEAMESLLYKSKDRDTSAYDDFTSDSEVSFGEAIKMYRTITGACESGVKYFVDNNIDKIKRNFLVSELIDLTIGQYGHEEFKNFFNKGVTK